MAAANLSAAERIKAASRGLRGTIVESHPSPADAPMRVAFGDADLGSLYLTAADGGLYRAKGIGRRGLKR